MEKLEITATGILGTISIFSVNADENTFFFKGDSDLDLPPMSEAVESMLVALSKRIGTATIDFFPAGKRSNSDPWGVPGHFRIQVE